MAGRRRKMESDLGRTSFGYGLMLGSAMKQAGLSKEDLAEPGLEGSQIWRLTTSKTTEKRPPVEAAERLRVALLRRLPGLELPPPAIAVESAEHYEWADLGKRLLTLDHEQFLKVLGSVRRVVEGLEGIGELGSAGGGDE